MTRLTALKSFQHTPVSKEWPNDGDNITHPFRVKEYFFALYPLKLSKLEFLGPEITGPIRAAALARALSDEPIKLPSKADTRLALIIALEVNPHLILFVEEAAALAGVTRKTFKAMMDAGRIKTPVNA